MLLSLSLWSRAAFLATTFPSPLLLSSTRTTITAPSALTTGACLEQHHVAGAPEWQSLATAIRHEAHRVLHQNKTLAGPFIRLAFHDAATFEYGPTYLSKGKAEKTGGPNGSIEYELENQSEHRALSRPLSIAQDIARQVVVPSLPAAGQRIATRNDKVDKDNMMIGNDSQLSSSCHSSPSLADVIALMGAQAVECAGGPHIPIRLGREDQFLADPQFRRIRQSKTTTRSVVTKTLPQANLDSDGLRLYFGRLQLSEAEFVALCGVHGLGRHVSLLGMPKSCLKQLTRACLEDAPVLLPFVSRSVDRFTNDYFKLLIRWYRREIELGEVAFIPTDVALVVDAGLRRHVERFASDEAYYFQVFRRAFQKLVDTTATTKDSY